MGGQDLKYLLGKNIRLLRIYNHLSQAELAEKADISINFLSELERGNKWPRADSLANICKALNIPVAELFNDTETASGTPGPLMAQFSKDLSRMVNHSIETICQQYAQYLPDDFKKHR
jgi:transcriptional regulator with XRE-family HTH domain